ncbi:MAG: mannose-6-phosphate isomerase [Nitrospiraceae bacterium]|nr:mannose-6-phosphate isomerase [Nitrospiraceae bacterium]
MKLDNVGLLRFHEGFFERVWGGSKLRILYGKDTPDKPIGESWVISDHSSHESVVSEGPYAGQTLRQLLEANADAILGSRPTLTVHGRFPLLLKILDAADVLSVQVHPDDEAAKRLGEPDVGKTEMWHVLQADLGSELICGLEPSVTAASLASAIDDGSIEAQMARFPATEGTSLFVPAGTVHAICGGSVLAEIQQNSDLTYRLYDWGRVGTDGKPRELHVEKAMAVTHFGKPSPGPTEPLRHERHGIPCAVLAACRDFAAELYEMCGAITRTTGGESFHILLAKSGTITVAAAGSETTLSPGEAVLVPGCLDAYSASGEGALLDYYVAGLEADIAAPLLAAGHPEASLARYALA